MKKRKKKSNKRLKDAVAVSSAAPQRIRKIKGLK